MRRSDRGLFTSLFKTLSPIFFFLFILLSFSLQINDVSAQQVLCGCGNGICDPSKGEMANCSGAGQDCSGKITCELEACNPVKNGCCPGSTAGGPKCQGVLMGQPDFDPDCSPSCYEEYCPNGLIDQPGENCEKGGKFKAGITCKPGTCIGVDVPPKDPMMAQFCHCCGDGSIDSPDEQCDPGNPIASEDACSVIKGPNASCNNSCQCVKCNDGIVDPGEECDGVGSPCSKGGMPGTCTDHCTCEPLCGNSRLDAGETCDDGSKNGTPGWPCRSDCHYCGDTLKNGPEQCDKSDLNKPPVGCMADQSCNDSCQCIVNPPPKCGDNTFNIASETCEFDVGMGGKVRSKDPLNECSEKGSTACRLPGSPNECSCCGDKIKQGSETCDEGKNNTPITDMSGACRVDCGFCGDSVKQAGEQCEVASDCGDPTKFKCNSCQCEEIIVPAPKCGDNAFNRPSETCEFDMAGNVTPKAPAVCTKTGLSACRSTGSPDECSCCGDQVVQGMETCDLGAGNKPLVDMSGACRVDCGSCGDGQKQASEQCESDSDCSMGQICNGCKCQAKPAKCGDDKIDLPGETCDGTDLGICKPGSCRTPGSANDCTCCGDAQKQGSETCDDGLENGNPGKCRATCTSCGDGVKQVGEGETCDDGAENGNPGKCRKSCTSCGDGTVQIGEGEACETDAQCGADESCSGCQCVKNPVVACGNGIYEPANNESCDGPQTGICGSNVCRPSKNSDPNQPSPCTCCGDRITQVASGEQCDNGTDNGKQGNGCDASCRLVPPATPKCGNSVIEGSETCDGATRASRIIDGHPVSIVCQQDCRDPNGQNSCSCCGDLMVDAPSEECDPPNGTTCNNECKLIVGGEPPNPNPNPNPQVTQPVLCSIEGAGGCGTNLSNVLPNPCTVSIIDPTLVQLTHSLNLAQWLTALFGPGVLFGLLRIRRFRK